MQCKYQRCVSVLEKPTLPMTHMYSKERQVCDFNLLTPNVNYSGRTAPLTSKVAFYIFIQQI